MIEDHSYNVIYTIIFALSSNSKKNGSVPILCIELTCVVFFYINNVINGLRSDSKHLSFSSAISLSEYIFSSSPKTLVRAWWSLLHISTDIWDLFNAGFERPSRRGFRGIYTFPLPSERWRSSKICYRWI